jgi:hypothetical protein
VTGTTSFRARMGTHMLLTVWCFQQRALGRKKQKLAASVRDRCERDADSPGGQMENEGLARD